MDALQRGLGTQEGVLHWDSQRQVGKWSLSAHVLQRAPSRFERFVQNIRKVDVGGTVAPGNGLPIVP